MVEIVKRQLPHQGTKTTPILSINKQVQAMYTWLRILANVNSNPHAFENREGDFSSVIIMLPYRSICE